MFGARGNNFSRKKEDFASRESLEIEVSGKYMYSYKNKNDKKI